MPRVAREVVKDLPYHITQRGNHGQQVFVDDSDRRLYLSWIAKYGQKYGLTIFAYCLMSNHIHLLVVPKKTDALARTFHIINTMHARNINEKKQLKGRLWEERYYSCVLNERHLVAAAKYIERNPVRARLVNCPWDWGWSSAKAHVSNVKADIDLGDLYELLGMSKECWREYVMSEDNSEIVGEIRRNTRKTKCKAGEDTEGYVKPKRENKSIYVF